MGIKNSLNEPQKIKTEDGYTFYRLMDGRYADSQDESCIDMYWSSYLEMISDFHHDKIGYTTFFE